MLQASDFYNTSRLPVAIAEPAKKRLLQQWEKFLDTPQRLLDRSTGTSPRDLINRKIDEFSKAILTKLPYRQGIPNIGIIFSETEHDVA